MLRALFGTLGKGHFVHSFAPMFEMVPCPQDTHSVCPATENRPIVQLLQLFTLFEPSILLYLPDGQLWQDDENDVDVE